MKRKRQSSGIGRPPATVQQPVTESVTQSVPPEIIFELLVRLPVESLGRFRCVSKLWNSMISSHQFVESHLARWSSRQKKLLLSCHDWEKYPIHSAISFYTLTYSGLDGQLDPKHNGTLRCSMMVCPDFVSQSLGGLVLVRLGRSIKIYNPSIREFVANVTTVQTSDGLAAKWFFGFDPIAKVHKVLAILSPRNNERRMDHRVLTLDGENKWRAIRDCGDAPVFLRSSNSICINGVVYYFTCSFERLVFVGFDVGKETFRVMEITSLLMEFFQFPLLRPMELQGRVAYVHGRELSPRNNDISLLLFQGFDEQEDPWIFRKISPPPSWKDSDLRYAGTTQSGEFLYVPHFVARPDDCQLFCYNWITGAARRTRVPGLHDPLAELYALMKDSHPYNRNAAALTVNEHVECLWSARDLQG